MQIITNLAFQNFGSVKCRIQGTKTIALFQTNFYKSKAVDETLKIESIEWLRKNMNSQFRENKHIEVHFCICTYKYTTMKAIEPMILLTSTVPQKILSKKVRWKI